VARIGLQMEFAMPKTEVARLAYSVAEGAQALGVSTITLHRGISHGLIRSAKLGARVIRIPVSEVERLLEEGMPPIPRDYLRKTTGPTKLGRPRGSKNKPKPAKRMRAARKHERERRVSP
jgi:excisionase family DNA binding protein